MTRATQIAIWLQQPWATGSHGGIYQNIRGYNVAVTPDHNNPEVWTWVITLHQQKSGDFSTRKYKDEDAAKQGVLEELADRLHI